MWSRKNDLFSPLGVSIYGSTWYAGIGAKARMQQQAATTGAACQLQITEPESGNRGFICFPTWTDALELLKPLKQHMRHINEIITYGSECKPYLDIDALDPPAELASKELVISRCESVVSGIFQDDYGIQLTTSDFVWLHSPNQKKLSLHLIICTKKPQFVFHSNHQTDPQGANHLANRIAAIDPLLGKFVDRAVYTKDREMRLAGSSKHDKPQSTLTIMGDHSIMDSIITWLEDDRKIITVPSSIPIAKKLGRVIKHPLDLIVRESSQDLTFVEQRILDLLRDVLHPSAFRDASHGREDVYDARVGIKFNHSDRSEPCYTGTVHDGCQNMTCWVDEHDEAYVRCFSSSCSQRCFHLGPVRADPSLYMDTAVKVDLQYLQRTKKAFFDSPRQLRSERSSPARLPSEARLRFSENSDDKFNHVIDRWLNGAFPALCIKSGMGTGKSTLLTSLLEEAFVGKTVVVVTYRQSLAYNIASKLPGFHLYLDGGDLTDRKLHACVICQLDSVRKLVKYDLQLIEFDFVVLDEAESLWNHVSAATIKDPVSLMMQFVPMLQRAKHILLMDALLGLQTHSFLDLCDIKHQIVVNTRKPVPRIFEFTNDTDKWTADILAKAKAGKKLVIPSMSTEVLYRLRAALLDAGIPDKDILMHTSKSGDALKKSLVNVNGVWVQVPIVMYSPTVESGVDFTPEHFDYMFAYACLGSTTPLGLFQMTGRVRNLRNLSISCCAQRGITLGHSRVPHVTFTDQLAFMQWIDLQVRGNVYASVVKCEDNMSFALPAHSPLLHLQAHNEARRLNAQGRFFLEFKDIAVQEGHIVRVLSPLTSPSRQLTSHPSVCKQKCSSLVLTSLSTSSRSSTAEFAATWLPKTTSGCTIGISTRPNGASTSSAKLSSMSTAQTLGVPKFTSACDCCSQTCALLTAVLSDTAPRCYRLRSSLRFWPPWDGLTLSMSTNLFLPTRLKLLSFKPTCSKTTPTTSACSTLGLNQQRRGTTRLSLIQYHSSWGPVGWGWNLLLLVRNWMGSGCEHTNTISRRTQRK